MKSVILLCLKREAKPTAEQLAIEIVVLSCSQHLLPVCPMPQKPRRREERSNIVPLPLCAAHRPSSCLCRLYQVEMWRER